jgi:maltooligosyltrehalose trehalohydrolase
MVSMLLLGPWLPMLFQGHECVTPSCFTYFADHEEPLATAVRKGRLEFLAQFPPLRDPETSARLPDPGDEKSFATSKIDRRGGPSAEQARRLHADLLHLRRSDRVLSGAGTPDVQIAASAPTPSLVLIRYAFGEEERLVVVNLGRRVQPRMNDPLLAPPAGCRWEMRWCSEHVDYGGEGVVAFDPGGQWDLQAMCGWILNALPATLKA